IPCLSGSNGLFHHRLQNFLMFIQISEEALVNDRVRDALNLAVPQLRFGLSLKLGIGQLNRENAGQPFLKVFARKILVFFPKDLGPTGNFVDSAGQSSSKACDVGSALNSMDHVGESKYALQVAVIVLNPYFDRSAVFFTGNYDWFWKER